MVTLHSLAREQPPMKVWAHSKLRRKIEYIRQHHPDLKMRLFISKPAYNWQNDKLTLTVRVGNRWVSPTSVISSNWSWNAGWFTGAEIGPAVDLVIVRSKSY